MMSFCQEQLDLGPIHPFHLLQAASGMRRLSRKITLWCALIAGKSLRSVPTLFDKFVVLNPPSL